MSGPLITYPEPSYPMVEMADTLVAPAQTLRRGRLLAALRRRWWILALTLIPALAAGVAYVRWMPPTYVSSARLWETEKLRLPEGVVFTEDPQNYFGTQAELLRSLKLCQLALTRLQAAGSNAVPKGLDGKPLPVKLRIAQPPRSTVFAVEASSSEPTYTQAYLDALINEYLEYKRNIRKVVSGDTLALISGQVLRLETDLKGYQDGLTAFQRTNNLAVLVEEGTIAGEYLSRLRTQLSDYKLEAQLLEASALEKSVATPVKTSGTGSDLVTSGEPATDAHAGPEHEAALRDLEMMKGLHAQLSKVLKPKHPRMIKLEGDIEREQRVIDMFHNQGREQLDSARQAVQMKLESVQSSIKESETRVADANARIAEAERLKLNVNRTQSLYDRMEMLLQNIDISRNIDQATAAILEPASPPERSYRREAMALGLATSAGLFLGFGLICMAAVRDDRFSSAAEIAEQLDANLIGQVPNFRSRKIRGIRTGPLLGEGDGQHWYAESYRSLRSALRFLGPDGQRPKVLLVTSAVAEEGKSTIAANLARVLALGGSRVLLVDGDLRRGRLHKMLGLKRELGLTGLLPGPGELDQVIQSNSLPNWAFLARGRDSSNPGDLFLSAQFDQLLDQLRERYDYVVIDSSPIFAADDATTLAPKADGTLLVVRSRFSRARAVREALELLAQRQARVLGLILNRVDGSARSYHGYRKLGYCELGKTAEADVTAS